MKVSDFDLLIQLGWNPFSGGTFRQMQQFRTTVNLATATKQNLLGASDVAEPLFELRRNENKCYVLIKMALACQTAIIPSNHSIQTFFPILIWWVIKVGHRTKQKHVYHPPALIMRCGVVERRFSHKKNILYDLYD